MPEQVATIEKVFLLQNCELFANATAEELLALANIAKEEEYEKGQTIFSAGESSSSFYFVVRGRVRLESNIKNIHEQAIEHQTIGVLSVLTAGPRSYSAIVEEDSLLLKIDVEDFYDYLSDEMEVGKGILQFLARQLPEKAVI
jgi:CRP-like cAMP-binding protein